jgi:hypothetical protein
VCLDGPKTAIFRPAEPAIYRANGLRRHPRPNWAVAQAQTGAPCHLPPRHPGNVGCTCVPDFAPVTWNAVSVTADESDRRPLQLGPPCRTPPRSLPQRGESSDQGCSRRMSVRRIGFSCPALSRTAWEWRLVATSTSIFTSAVSSALPPVAHFWYEPPVDQGPQPVFFRILAARIGLAVGTGLTPGSAPLVGTG